MKDKTVMYIILIYILLQSVLDMFITILPNIPISTMVRGLFFLFAIVFLLRNKMNLKLNIILMFLMAIYLSYSYLYLDYSIVESISVTLKLFYLPYIIILFSNLKYDEKYKKALLASLILYISIYLFSYIFDIGYNNYLKTDGKSGYRGLFNSINEFSAILVILYYYVFDYLKKKKNILLFIITILLLVISFLTGTKVLTGGVILIVIINLIPFIYKYFKDSSNKKKIILSVSFILLVTITILIFINSNTYKNMLVQAEFFKVNNIFSIDGINKVIFNDRLSFLVDNNKFFFDKNILDMVLGIGYNNSFKLVEIDIFDILYRYGIISFLGIITLFIYTFKTYKFNKVNIIGIIILLLISLTSGHVLLSPAVSIYFGIIVLLNKEKKKMAKK